VETADGECFRLGFRNLSGGRAMLEHVRQGGKPYDIRGCHLTEMVSEIATLSRFNRASAGRVLEGVTQEVVSQAQVYHKQLRENLKRMSTSRGYTKYFESWHPADITEQEELVENIKTLFVEQTIDTRIEQALPLLAKIQQGRDMKEAEIFESWINNLAEGTWNLPETPEQLDKLKTLMTSELIVGPDATNATEQLYDLVGDDILFDRLSALAAQDPRANAWNDTEVMNRLAELGIQTPEPAAPDMAAQPQQGLQEGRNEIATGTPDAIKAKIAELGLGPYRRESTGSGGEAIFVFKNPKYYNYYIYQGQDGAWVLVQTNTAPGPVAEEGVVDAVKSGVQKVKQFGKDFKDAGKRVWDEEVPKLKQDWQHPIKTAMAEDNDPLNKYRQRVQAQGFTDSPEERDDDRLERKRRRYAALDRISNIGGLGSDEEAKHQAQQRMNRDTYDTQRRKDIDSDDRKTMDMMRDRLNRYQYSTQRDVDPEQLKKITDIKYVSNEDTSRGVDAKGRTQAQWIQMVKAKFPDAKIMQAKMIDGPVQVTLPDGRKLGWKKVEQAVTESTELNTMLKYAGVPVSESRMIDESGETLMHILDRFKHEVAQFEQGADLDDNLYDALYDYYANSGEMPYGTMKARDGDPYEWISDRLDQELGTGNHAMRAVPEADAISTFEVMSGFDAPVAEGACNMTAEGSYCPEHGLAECGGMYEDLGGELSGGIAGGRAGALAGTALGGPVGGLIGGALGSTGGAMIGDRLTMETSSYSESREGDAILARIKSLALIK
jgi:hypothetical protein